MKIGDKVVMTNAELKRNLSNWMYEMYVHPSGIVDSEYHGMVQISLLATMNPLVGTVIGFGTGKCVKAKFKISGLEYNAYFEHYSLNLFNKGK